MSNAKQLVIKSLSDISDDIQDEFEILENLYKLIKLEKSRQSIQEEGSYTTEEARQKKKKKYGNIISETHIPLENNKKSGAVI